MKKSLDSITQMYYNISDFEEVKRGLNCNLYKGQIAVTDCFKEKDLLKDEFGAIWEAKNKQWLIYPSYDNLIKLRTRFAPRIDDKLIKYFEDRKKLAEVIRKYDRGELKVDYDYNKYFVDEVNGKPFSLMEHQKIGANIANILFYNNFTGCLLSMDMGTGKTLTAMSVLNRLAEDNGVKRCLIVCPKIAMPVWKREFATFEKDEYKLGLLMGTPKKRLQVANAINEDPSKRLNILVINYEYVYAFQNIIEQWKPDAIICDESHKIKGVSTNQTKAITQIGKNVRYKICLTGTPLTSNILDYFSQFRFLDSSVFGLNYYAFKNRYVITGMFGEYLRPNKTTFDEFKEKVSSVSFRRTREECLDLPEFVDINIPVELSPACKKIYKELEDEYVSWLSDNECITVENALTKTLKLRQITSGFYYKTDETTGERYTIFVDTSKLDSVFELIQEIIESGRKVVVFAEFQAEIEKLCEMCRKANIEFIDYYSKTKDKDKATAEDRFQNGTPMVFIGQIESAGISITLTKSYVTIFVSTGYKYGVYDQARGRIYRNGQKNNCTYYHFIAENTIDESIIKSLNKKEKLAKSIIDEYRKRKG